MLGLFRFWARTPGSLKSPVGRNCKPYKEIIDQIRSILPWLLEALGGSGSGGLKTPVADTCGPYKKIIDQICSILPWLLEA